MLASERLQTELRVMCLPISEELRPFKSDDLRGVINSDIRKALDSKTVPLSYAVDLLNECDALREQHVIDAAKIRELEAELIKLRTALAADAVSGWETATPPIILPEPRQTPKTCVAEVEEDELEAEWLSRLPAQPAEPVLPVESPPSRVRAPLPGAETRVVQSTSAAKTPDGPQNAQNTGNSDGAGDPPPKPKRNGPAKHPRMAEAVALYEGGTSLKQSAAATTVPISSLSQELKRLGIKTRGKGRQPSPPANLDTAKAAMGKIENDRQGGHQWVPQEPESEHRGVPPPGPNGIKASTVILIIERNGDGKTSDEIREEFGLPLQDVLRVIQDQYAAGRIASYKAAKQCGTLSDWREETLAALRGAR